VELSRCQIQTLPNDKKKKTQLDAAISALAFTPETQEGACKCLLVAHANGVIKVRAARSPTLF
jgi:hypothetical protein